MLYTIAIPTYNRYDLLKISLEKIVNQIENLGNGELLVIDDASTDLTVDLLKEYSSKFTFFRYIISAKNNGISKTRNLLLDNAKGKYIIFVDSDVIISDNLIKNHLNILENNPNVICQSQLIITDDLNKIKSANVLTDKSRAYFDTANLSIERNKLIEAGYFDENFSGYGWEDLELGLRLKANGLKCIKKNYIYSYHYQEKPNIKNIDSYIKKELQRAKGAIFFNKKHPSLEVKAMTQIFFIFQLPTLIVGKIFKFEKNFEKTIEKFSEKDYNIFIFLFRTYMNYIYIKELRSLLKRI